MARYTLVSQDELSNLKFAPSGAQTQIYNALGRSAGTDGGNQNFLQKKWNSIENAIGSTGAAIVSPLVDAAHNAETSRLVNSAVSGRDDIAKRYGYNNIDDLYTALDAAEASGDTDTMNRLLMAEKEDQEFTKANAEAMKQRSAEFDDYRKNNYIGQKIQQDRGKFAGSALNTLSTGFDVLSMAAGIPNGALINAGQGALEGIADELEANGLENFDWGRAGQNAAVGAAAGAATGALNSKIDSRMASNGGRILSGNNAIARGADAALRSGIGRGALSGAVGGATGAGLSSAMNGAELSEGVQNALTGAGQGALQGAIAGGTMSAANRLGNAALNRVAPNIAQGLQENATRNASYGDTLSDQLRGAWNSGDSAVAEYLKTTPGRVNRLADTVNGSPLRNIGGTLENMGVDEPAQPMDTRQSMGGETTQPSTNNAQWDNLARESGYADYNDLVQKFVESNPNTDATAGNILDWAERQRVNGNADRITAKTSREAKLKYAQGKELMSQYGTVDAPMARATKAVETFQEIADMGFDKPADVERMANAITGANGTVSEFMRNVVRTAEPVDTWAGVKNGQSIDEYIDSSIEHNMLSGTTQGKAVKRALDAYLKALPSRAEGSVTFDDSAADVFKMVQGLEAKAAELEGRGGSTYHRATTEDIHQAAVIKDVAELLKDRIYAGADVKGSLTPAATQQLKALAPGNAKWEATVDKFVTGAKTPQDLRTFQKPWVRASRYIDNQYTQAATVGGRMAANAGGLSSALPTTRSGLTKQLVDGAWNSNAARRARARVYDKLAERAASSASSTPTTPTTPTTSAPTAQLSNLGMPTASATTTPVEGAPTGVAPTNSIAPATTLYNMIGREEGLQNGEQISVANNPSGIVTDEGASNRTLEDLFSAPMASTTGVYGSVYGTNTGRTAPAVASQESEQAIYFFPPTGDQLTDMLSQAMRNAKNAEDYEALGQLYEMYRNAVANSTAKTVSDLSSAQQAQLAKLDSADSAIDELETLFDRAGGGKGPLAGGLQSIAGDWGLDSNARTYNQLSEGLVNQIALAIGKTDSLNTEGEVKRALQLIPQLTDDATTAKNKLEELRKMLATTKASYNAAYGLAN